ncbi:hypothetical protein Pan216_07860 [Planctomycetes bacterium Pan216]|uniref:Uncharacterized protein n=1 Tax=Kolteria novifilia TaxID=2527975 RepID=A0A518AYZ3_9BACT|nr:hypothetical protein Pan216_07860 [Planctomycetes bacterium Pan216]
MSGALDPDGVYVVASTWDEGESGRVHAGDGQEGATHVRDDEHEQVPPSWLMSRHRQW